jgi:hypothetical protein
MSEQTILEDKFQVCDIEYILRLYDLHSIEADNKRSVLVEFFREGKVLFLFQIEVPRHVAIDSEAAASAAMGFICMRPGDTDKEYFDEYTDEQMSFAECEAEYLMAELLTPMELTVEML